MVVSAGILIVSPKGWLLAHATNTNRWDIPKGRQDEGETPLQTALRETLEETNLDLSLFAHQLEDLGEQPYMPQKRLHLFKLHLDQPLDLSKCCCHTYVTVERLGKTFPETDKWEWVLEEDVLGRVGKSLGKLFLRLELLASTNTETPTTPHKKSDL